MILCILLYLPGLDQLPVLDRDEARYAQSSRQMLEQGDFVDVRFQNKTRYQKPVGIYWLQALSSAWFGEREKIWVYRLPSVLGATVSVLLLFWFGSQFFDRQKAFLASVLLGSCPLVVVEAHIATTDATLLVTVIAAQGALGLIYLHGRRDWKAAFLFWTAQGLGILIKGPLVPLVSVVTVSALAIYDRVHRRDLTWLLRLRPVMGVALLLLICAPWFVAIHIKSDGTYWIESFRRDFLAKIVSGQEMHGRPPGYYLVHLPFTFWPASVLALAIVPVIWRTAAQKEIIYCLAWMIPLWVIFELVPTKLPHYVLPLYPAAALLCGHGICESKSRMPRRFLLIPGVLIGVMCALVPVVLPYLMETSPGVLSILCMLMILAGLFLSVSWIIKNKPWLGVAGLVVVAWLFYTTMFCHVLPSLTPLWPSSMIAQIVRQYADKGTSLVAAGYHEPSLVFLLGGQVQLVSGEAAGLLMMSRANVLSIVADNQKDPFCAVISESETPITRIATLRSFYYTKGRWIDVDMYSNTACGYEPLMKGQLAPAK